MNSNIIVPLILECFVASLILSTALFVPAEGTNIRMRRGYDPQAAVHNAEAQEAAWLAGAALPAQHVAAAQAAYRADQAKTSQTLVNAEALKAVNAIGALDQAAQYSFSGGGGYGGYGK